MDDEKPERGRLVIQEGVSEVFACDIVANSLNAATLMGSSTVVEEKKVNQLPNFPLKITVDLADESGLVFGLLSVSEAMAVDGMVRRAMIVGFDACLTSLKLSGVEHVVECREKFETGLLGGE